jgi:DnaJ homolog subfamily C member 19
MSTPILVGVGVAAAAWGSRAALLAWKQHGHHLKGIKLPSMSSMTGGYYRGGFESKMTRREATMILGLK